MTSYFALKRLFDVFFSAILIALLVPVFLIVSLAIWAVDGRPILFVQYRPGRNASLFGLLKFRSMISSGPSEQANADVALSYSGNGLTRLGRFLRRTSIDELPQLFNIFAGHMSFIGPRPLLADYLSSYDSRQMRRHEVRPGLTGLAQVQGRNTLNWETKLAYDLEYVDKASMSLDFLILTRSVWVLLSRDGIEPKSLDSLRPPKN